MIGSRWSLLSSTLTVFVRRDAAPRCSPKFDKIDRSMPIVAETEQMGSSKFLFEIKSAIF
jgi:hypothetical protein